MKKHTLLILSVVLFAACTKEYEEQNTLESPVFNAVMENGTDTKVHLNESLKSRWDADDSISVFAGNIVNQQYIFNGSTGDAEGSFSPVGNAGSGSSLDASYAVYPYNSGTSISVDGRISVSFPAMQSYAAGSYGVGSNTMVAVTSGIEDNDLIFKNACGYLRISLYGEATITDITLEGNNGEKLAGAGTITASFSEAPSVAMSSSASGFITINCGDGVQIGNSSSTATDFYFVVPPVEFSQGITISAKDDEGKVFKKSTSKSISITRNTIQKMAALEYEGEVPVDELVDLGLSVKWRSWNIGASSPEGSGLYYQWGDTQGYGSDTSDGKYFYWGLNGTSTYMWCNGSSSKLTKYNTASSNGTVDNKIVLDLEDDAATAALGGSWRMPTDAEWAELMNTSNCTWTWTTMNEVNGYKVQSLKSGYTDKWIFLPVAGYRTQKSLYQVRSTGNYMSSSLDTSTPYLTTVLIFTSSDIVSGGADRCLGRTIRPVYSDDPTSGVTGISLNKTALLLVQGATETLAATVSKNTGAVNDQVEWSSSDSSVATVDYTGKVTAVASGNATITAKTVFGSYTSTCSVTVAATDPTVDLGLSVKWATCNLGATSPDEYGDYYAWGAIEPLYEAGYAQEMPQTHWKTGRSAGYCWKNTPYQTANAILSRDVRLTKYIGSTTSSMKDTSATDADAMKIILDSADDAANAAFGDGWRMPTDAEWTELMNASNCTWTWTTLNGVDGYKIQSKKSGYTDNWIFLPAAGNRLNVSMYDTGTRGLYWSSSLDKSEGPILASMVNLVSSSFKSDVYSRYFGLSVRPVYSDDSTSGVTGISLNKMSSMLEIDATETLAATVSKNTGAVNDQVEWSSSDLSVATVDCTGKVTAVAAGTAIITAKTVFGSFTASCSVRVNDPRLVDLGLSVKWANCNLGASSPSGYGLYYQWGDTQGYGSDTSDGKYFFWTSYKWSNGTKYSLTKYNTDSDFGKVDNKKVLDPEDDAARASWGGQWRMPTDAEWTELRNNCSWTWTTVDGVNGYKVKSNKSGYTDKWIFLPASGYRYFDELRNVGSLGDYWSSSCISSSSDARSVSFDSSKFERDKDSRFDGQSVRPVLD